MSPVNRHDNRAPVFPTGVPKNKQTRSVVTSSQKFKEKYLIQITTMSGPYNVVETRCSIYVTVRKSVLKSTQNLENPIVVNQDDKIKKIEEVNPHLEKDLEEAFV